MEDIFRQNRNAYDQIVLEYASRNHGLMPENLIRLAQLFLRQVGSNGHILEVGCGTGRDMAYFESQGVSVTGIDLSWGMLAFARQWVHGPLCQANMSQLPFSGEFFDGAWCCASLLHIPKPAVQPALAEIRRILKPNAMLVLEIQGGDWEGWEESYVPGVQRFFARYQEDEMAKLLAASGYSVQAVDAVRGGHRDWLSFVCVKEIRNG